MRTRVLTILGFGLARVMRPAIAMHDLGVRGAPGGVPRAASGKSPVERAAEIARHREAQRALIPMPATAAPSNPVTSRDSTLSAPAAAAAPYWTNFRGRDGGDDCYAIPNHGIHSSRASDERPITPWDRRSI